MADSGASSRWLSIVLLGLFGCEASVSEASRSPLTAAEPGASAQPSPQPSAAEAVGLPNPPSPSPSHEPAAELVAGTFLLQDDVLKGLERASLGQVRPVGSTSTVFRAELDVPFRAAFKLATWIRPVGALHEVAAYRLARCLGLSNVPPAILRRLPKEELRHKLDPAFLRHWPALVESMVTDRGGVVEGALIYWVEELQDLGLENPETTAQLLEWLQIDREPPPEQAKLAMQLSTLLAFDYLIGNWDRWSGSNLKGDGAGEVLYMRDNDAAFARSIGEPILRRMLQPVIQTERYSRSFVTALQALSRESFAAELARDPELGRRDPAEPLGKGERLRRPVMDEAAIDRVFDRRDTLLTHVAALIEQYGAQRVLSFP